MLHTSYHLPSGAYFDTYIMNSEINYREYRKRPAIIVAPGGAYAIHATKESEPVAIQFMQMGYQVFVLHYSVGSDRSHPERGILKHARYPLQVIEMLEALHIVKEHADEWHIDANRIFLMGFSAGGHVCASCGVRWKDAKIVEQLSFIPKEEELKVNGIVLGYPFLVPNSDEFFEQHHLEAVQRVQGITNYVLYQSDTPSREDFDKVNLLNYISKDTVPMFLWHSIDDPVIDARNSTRFITKLLDYGIPAEYHLFGHGEHGKALENRLTHQPQETIDNHLNSWISLADYWMNRMGKE